MAEISADIARPASAWAAIVAPGRGGAERATAGLIVELIAQPSLATILAPPDGFGPLAEAILRHYGVVLPDRLRIGIGATACFVWSGPGQWLALSPEPGLPARLREQLGDRAAIADQTGSRAVMRLSGPALRDVLAKGCSLDLHPRAFRAGDAALTSIAHIGVQIWQAEAEPEITVAVPRSMAGSFWSWLEASAAVSGYEVREAAPSSSEPISCGLTQSRASRGASLPDRSSA